MLPLTYPASWGDGDKFLSPSSSLWVQAEREEGSLQLVKGAEIPCVGVKSEIS